VINHVKCLFKLLYLSLVEHSEDLKEALLVCYQFIYSD
jgi:hypothetical protein